MPSRRTLIAVLTVAGLLGPFGCGCALAGSFSGITIDGPSADIVGGGNVSLARDGTGGITYLKNVAGTPHVFASLQQPGGPWSEPLQIDANLPGAATQAAIAAASNGRVVAAFITGGTLYTTVANGSPEFTAPQPLASGAANLSLGISTNGTAYVSFTGSGPAGSEGDIYVARLDRAANAFSLFPQPANLDPTRPAGYDGVTRSMLAVATDGQALVTWGEVGADGRTHVIARRAALQGLSPAVQDITLPSLSGQPGGSADTPFVDLRDAADFGWIVFRQTFFVGGAPESRVIARFERGSSFDDPNPVDPLSFPSADGAADPAVGLDGDGSGLTTVGLTSSHQVYADPILDPDSVMDPELGTPERLDSAPANVVDPQPLPAIGGIDDVGAVAWEQSTGPADPPAVHARAFANSGLAAEAVISAAPLGPVDTSRGGLTGAADRYGDAVFAFVQGDPANRRIVLGGVANPPGDFDLLHANASRSLQPVLAWTSSKDVLGIASYQVRVDGKVVATVTARHVRLPPLSLGAHRVSVLAVDRYNQVTPSPQHILVIDNRPPHPRLSVSGSRSAGSSLRFSVTPGDGPHSSGIASVRVEFGDGASASGTHVSHAYSRAGGFTVRVVVRDRAGNVGTVTERLQIG